MQQRIFVPTTPPATAVILYTNEMKVCIRKSLIVSVLAVFLTGTPAVTEAATYQYDTFACRFFNIVLKPFGGCQQEQEQSPAPSSTPVVSPASPTAKIVPTPNPAPSDNLPAATSSQDTATPATNNITNEYITVQSSGVSESQLNARLALYALRSHSHTSNTDTNSPSTIQVELDRLEALLDDRRLRQTDRVYDSISDSRSSITSGGTLTDTTLSGALTLPDITTNLLLYANSSGVLSAATGLNITNNSLAIGTTTAHEKLTIDGPIYLGSNTPTTTTNRLYNQTGSLYWNGSVIAGASVGSWDTNGSDVYRLTGNVGIGTTTPNAKLTVAGDINLTAGNAYKYNGADVIIASTTLNNYFFGGAGNLTMTGDSNTANGLQALYFNTTGNNNTANGFQAGYDINTAGGTGANTVIGYNTGRGIVTGVNNTILGANVTGLSSTLSNNIIIADGAGNQRINVDGSGNVGIGTSTPANRLTVFDTVADAQFSLAYDAARFANFQVDSAGTLLLSPTGNDVEIYNSNLSVCEGVACPSITASSTAGYGIFENGIYFGNGFKIDQTSSSSAELGVYDDAGAIIMIFD